MKQILVRSYNAEGKEFQRRMQMIQQASCLVDKYIRETSFSRDEIIKGVVDETGIDAGTVNWMML